MQDLYSTDLTLETSSRSCRYTASTGQYRARSYRSEIYLSALKNLNHEVGIDDLSDVRVAGSHEV